MALTEAYNTVKRALSTAPPTDAYLRYDAPAVETVLPNEEDTARQIGSTMTRMQQHNLDKHRHCFRATHVKTQGIVKGTLTVPSLLPSHLQQGLFKTPGRTYPVAARYANEPIFLTPDQEPGPRGLSMRVFGAEGERLEGASSDAVQDFFFNNAPSIELTDINTCLEIMQMRERYFDSPVKLAAATRLRTDAVKQTSPFRLPNTNLIGMNYYSQSAFRFGEWYGHLGLFPVGQETTGRNEKVGSGDSREVLSDWLKEHFGGKGATYELRVSRHWIRSEVPGFRS